MASQVMEQGRLVVLVVFVVVVVVLGAGGFVSVPSPSHKARFKWRKDV